MDPLFASVLIFFALVIVALVAMAREKDDVAQKTLEILKNWTETNTSKDQK